MTDKSWSPENWGTHHVKIMVENDRAGVYEKGFEAGADAMLDALRAGARETITLGSEFRDGKFRGGRWIFILADEVVK